jgi:hypothetical protein
MWKNLTFKFYRKTVLHIEAKEKDYLKGEL